MIIYFVHTQSLVLLLLAAAAIAVLLVVSSYDIASSKNSFLNFFVVFQFLATLCRSSFASFESQRRKKISGNNFVCRIVVV